MVHTDASNVGLGVTLVLRRDGGERILAFTRGVQLLHPENECLPHVWAVKEFHPCLMASILGYKRPPLAMPVDNPEELIRTSCTLDHATPGVRHDYCV